MSDYKFLTLKDAISSINKKVNLIAVILDFSLPQTTKGTDYMVKLKIIDESHPEISVHVFEKEMDHLPLVSAVGDIIHLSRVTMRMYEEDLYAIYNKKFSSFALYDGKDGGNFLPYQVSSGYNAREHGEIIIAGLRNWLASSKVIDVPNFLLLKEINKAGSINLACKVLNMCKTTDDKWMVFLWDGTDAPPLSIDKRLEDEMHNPLPLHLDFEPFPSSRDVLCKFPTVGTILRVILEVDCITYIRRLMKFSQWLKLFSISLKEQEGLWYGVFTSSSKIRGMPNDDILILERQSNYDRRTVGELARMPYWSFPWPSRITEVNIDDVPFATLMDVLTCKKVMKFRCVIRVVASIPWRVEDFRSPLGNYRVRLTLEDPTARIHAFAYAEDGEFFFDRSSTVALKPKLNKLLGVPVSDNENETEGVARNPPWVQCSLKSHPEKECRWICDTKLLG